MFRTHGGGEREDGTRIGGRPFSSVSKLSGLVSRVISSPVIMLTNSHDITVKETYIRISSDRRCQLGVWTSLPIGHESEYWIEGGLL